MLLKAAILCCLLTVTLAADEHKSKKKDVRGKRNLEYSISHHYTVPNYRLERRISTVPHLTRYPPFFPGPPGPRSISYRKGRPQSLPPPPYAVQMEPLIHYSQRDPLYESALLSLPTVSQNDIVRNEDLVPENTQASDNIYGPPKHVIERPVYIKEPEPIIEIIIKESNVTLPPVPVPQVTPAPKTKEQVQVFYVKYRKNPNGHGKDSIIYEKPVPAISQVKHEEEVEERQNYNPPEYVTSPPPPSTTLRAIIKPESETFHAQKGIHITFGSELKQAQPYDDINEESAPHPAVSLPQGREFHGDFPRRPPNAPPNFRPEPHRIPQPYRPFNQPPNANLLKAQHPQFGRKLPPQLHSQLPSRNPPPPFQAPPNTQFPTQSSNRIPPQFHQNPRQPPPPFNPQHSFPDSSNFRQPVPYVPFDQVRSHVQESFQFPRPHTHFPIRPESPTNQQPQAFKQEFRQQQLPVVRQQQIFSQQQFPPVSHQNFHEQSFKGNEFNQAQQPSFQQAQQHPPNQQFSNQQRPQIPPNLQQQREHFESLQQQQHRQVQFPNQQNVLRDQQHQEQIKQQQLLAQQQLQFQHSQSQLNQQQSQVQPYNFENQQQNHPTLPPGGELISSVPKYEQHITVDESGRQQQTPQALPFQQPQQQQQKHLSAEQFQTQVQQQFKQGINSEVDSQKQELIQQQQYSKQLPQEELQHQQQLQQQQLHQQQFQQQQQIQQQQIQQEQFQKQKELEKQQQQYNQNRNAQRPPQQDPFYIGTTHAPPAARFTYQTTEKPVTTTERKPETTTKDIKELSLQLPDEVPDDLREQLLSSGILNHAQISILDYDKVGDIPISALPPDQLANFYNAGGAEQIAAAGSAPVASVVKDPDAESDMLGEGSEMDEVKMEKPAVEMKVVHYDPQTEEGKKVRDSYVQDGAAEVDPVVLDDQSYNRYLPLKVNGAQFPIPDIPELIGKEVNSVVVLAPIDYKFKEGSRVTRSASKSTDGIKFITGSVLQELIEKPTRENYIKFLENENRTSSDKQAVILLVTGTSDTPKENREIFMYDVATQSVSKLSGELSSAFVDAAEANADPTDDASVAASNLVEIRVKPANTAQIDRMDAEADLDESPSDITESAISIIDPMEPDLEPEASDQLERFVDISGQDLTASDTKNSVENEVRIESGYSKTGYNLPLQ